MIGLDVTLLARATLAVRQRMGALGQLGSRLLLPAIAQYHDSQDTTGEPPVHDVCAIAAIADPAAFGYTPALVQVETQGRFTSGMTVTDFTAADGPQRPGRDLDRRRPLLGDRARRLRPAAGGRG